MYCCIDIFQMLWTQWNLLINFYIYQDEKQRTCLFLLPTKSSTEMIIKYPITLYKSTKIGEKVSTCLKLGDFNEIMKMNNKYRSKWWSSMKKKWPRIEMALEERKAINLMTELQRGSQFRHRHYLTKTLNPGQLTSGYIL